MAKIYGNIATINNNHTIKVSIYNKNLSMPDINIDRSNSVKFSAEPVEITQQQDDTFAHILKTQCKIRLVTKQWLGDYLFAANYSSIVVNVWVDNHCVFCGYVVPRTYNQNYAYQWEEVEINCVDVLSTLKDRRLTDNISYEELVAQSTTRPFSWFLGNMDLDTTTVVIPNFPDINYEEAEMAWFEVDWTRVVNPDDSIDYYGIEAEVVLLDDNTGMNTGNTRQGEHKNVTWVESTDTCIVDGVSYYKEYAHITVAGNDVNTGDWRVGINAGGMPYVVETVTRLTGWSTGVLPQPFDFWEHLTTFDVYSNGMEIAVSDSIGEQIPETPQTTTNGSYYEFRQGADDDLDYDEDTQTYYYKNYAWVCVNNECTNSGQWQRGNEYRHQIGTHTALTGWQYDNPPVAFEYFETISHYIDYSNGTSDLDYTSMGHQILLSPNATPNGSYYEFRQGDDDDLDVDQLTGYQYYKDYAWVVVNNVAEKTTNWRRGLRVNQYNYAQIYGKMISGATNPPSIKYGQGTSSATYTANLFDSTNGDFGFTNLPTYNSPWNVLQAEKSNIEEIYYNISGGHTEGFDDEFTNCTNLKVADISCYYPINLKNAFKGCTALTTLRMKSSSSWHCIFESAFEGCTNLPNVIDLSDVCVDRCSNMFKNCTTLRTVKLSGWTQMYNGAYNYTSTGLFDGSSIREVYYYLDDRVFNNLEFFQLMYGSLMSATSKPTLIMPYTFGVNDVEYRLTYDSTNSCYESNFDIAIYDDANGIIQSSVVCTLDDWTTLTLTPVERSGYLLYKIPNANRQHIREISVGGFSVIIAMPLDKYIWNSTDDIEPEFTFNSNIRYLDVSLLNNIPYNCDNMFSGLSNLNTLYLGRHDYSNSSHTDMFYNCSNLQTVYMTNREARIELLGGTGPDYIPTTATVNCFDTYSSYTDGWGTWEYDSNTGQWEQI